MDPNQDTTDYSKPVAYDTNGRPLYARPPEQGQTNPGQTTSETELGQQTVHIMRPLDPEKAVISPELRQKHEESVRQYPNLNLSEGEYVISAVRRHPIGLVPIFMAVIGGLASLFLVAFMLTNSAKSTLSSGQSLSAPAIYGLAFVLGTLVILFGFFAVYIYINNRFFLTNESVVQEIRTGLFSKHEQTVSLWNIEDASFSQENIFATIFGYGAIRLSTEGDETTYRFSYVSNPKKQIALLNNAVEAFKNGRPVDPSDN